MHWPEEITTVGDEVPVSPWFDLASALMVGLVVCFAWRDVSARHAISRIVLPAIVMAVLVVRPTRRASCKAPP